MFASEWKWAFSQFWNNWPLFVLHSLAAFCHKSNHIDSDSSFCAVWKLLIQTTYCKLYLWFPNAIMSFKPFNFICDCLSRTPLSYHSWQYICLHVQLSIQVFLFIVLSGARSPLQCTKSARQPFWHREG